MTKDELSLVAIYNKGNRKETIEGLKEMKTYLEPDEKKLMKLTDSAIAKLEAMTDNEYEALDLYPEF